MNRKQELNSANVGDFIYTSGIKDMSNRSIKLGILPVALSVSSEINFYVNEPVTAKRIAFVDGVQVVFRKRIDPNTFYTTRGDVTGFIYLTERGNSGCVSAFSDGS